MDLCPLCGGAMAPLPGVVNVNGAAPFTVVEFRNTAPANAAAAQPWTAVYPVGAAAGAAPVAYTMVRV